LLLGALFALAALIAIGPERAALAQAQPPAKKAAAPAPAKPAAAKDGGRKPVKAPLGKAGADADSKGREAALDASGNGDDKRRT
jgi:hypothetical protein